MTGEEMENGWGEYKRDILNRLDELKKDMAALRKENKDLLTDVAVLKERMRATSIIYGILGGAIPVAIMIAIRLWGG